MRGDRSLELGGPKRMAVLLALLLAEGRVVPSDRLIDMLWGDEPPPSAPNALQVHVSRLRESLEPTGPPYRLLRTEPSGYRLVLDPDQVDAFVFEEQLHRGRACLERGEAEAAESALAGALALWRGPALGELADHSHFHDEARRLEELRLVALEERIAADLALGRHLELVGELEALAGAHPFRERFWGQLMVALYRSGRQAEALEAYQAARRLLGEELGLEPSPELRDLEGRILVQDPALASGHEARHNLPAPLSRMVGRARELEDLLAGLEEARLLTLTGVGGAGKTRLALEASWRLLDRHPDGIWWVELADLADASLVPRHVVRAMRMIEQPDRSPEETLVWALRGGAHLLVLDNCEHLLPDIAHLCGRLAAAVPALRVLTTSRERLGIPGEKVFPLRPLSVPPDHHPELEEVGGYEAVELFCERASEVDPAFRLGVGNASLVLRICRRLEGIPLALELAAGKVAHLSLEEIADQLDDSVGLSLPGPSPGPPRHRTLRAALAWSHRLLEPEEQVVFRRLGVFRGGFDRAAVEEVCGDDAQEPEGVAPALLSLVERSLVVADIRGDRARYRLLEPVRAYALERLEEAGETSMLRDRHLAFFRRLAETGAEGLRGPGQAKWRTRLELEHDNLRAALSWTLESGRPGDGLELAGLLAWFWWWTGFLTEGRRWLTTLLEHRGVASRATVARALRGAGLLAVTQGDLEAAAPLLEEALSLYERLEDPVGLAFTRSFVGLACWAGGDLGGAEELLTDALAGFRDVGSGWGVGAALNMLGRIARFRDDPERARTLHQEALTAFRELGDRLGTAVALDWLSVATAETGDLERAVELNRESLRLYEESGFREGLASALNELGRLELRRGRPELAGRAFLRSLRLCRDLGHRGGLARALEGLGEVEHRADPARAIRLLAAANALREAGQLALAEGEEEELSRILDEVRGASGEERFEELWSRAVAEGVDEVLAEVLAGAQP